MKTKKLRKIIREELAKLLYMRDLVDRMENSDLRERLEDANPTMGGSPENPITGIFDNPAKWGDNAPHSIPTGNGPTYKGVEPRGYETAPSDLATNPMGGKPVPVSAMTPNRDPGSSDYTFWFSDEELQRLGIPEMSYHLEEVPGSNGKLRIVEGPPTSLLPGHEEILRERLKNEENK